MLKNPVLVEALYDREAAHDATLRNLLQRKGYADLEAVLAEGLEQGHKQGLQQGHKQGRAEGLRAGVRDLCEVLGVALTPERDAALEVMEESELLALRDHLKRERRWA